MKEIFKNVREKLVAKYLKNNISKDYSKSTKKFKPRIKARIRKNKQFISKNIEIMSMGLMTESDEAVAWRGPMLSSAVRQLSNSTKWSNLDFLFIDMPPGTGDTYLTIFKELNLSNVILVTTPNKLSYADIKKTINLVNKFNVPIMGYIENNIFNQDKDTSSEKLSINKLGKFNFSEKMLNFDLDNDIEDANLISKKIIAHV